MPYSLEPYDHLAKRRAILDESGSPIAWVDYDDVSREEADSIAERLLQGLTMDAPTEILHDLSPQAMEFIVQWHGREIHISRYDNHHNILDGWSVCSWKNRPYNDSTNPFYLGRDGAWRYKNGVTFSTYKDALDALKTASRPGISGWMSDGS